VRIEHHKNKALAWHPLKETIDGQTVKFYAEGEDILSPSLAAMPRRPCQGDGAVRVGRDTQAACASLGAQAAGRTTQHGFSIWRNSISKCAKNPRDNKTDSVNGPSKVLPMSPE
jgi:hypothetical protein